MKCRNTVVPGAGLVVEEQLDAQQAHGAILQFPQLIDGIPIVAGNPGHRRPAKVRTVMVSPDPLLVALDQDPVRPRAAGLDPAISLECRQYTRSLGHMPTVGHGTVSPGLPGPCRRAPVHEPHSNLGDTGFSHSRAHSRGMIQHDLVPVPADACQTSDQLNRAIAAYLTRFTGASRDQARSDLRAFPLLVRRATSGTADGTSAAPRAVHPLDAGDPPFQALHSFAAVLRRRGLLPDRRHRRQPG